MLKYKIFELKPTDITIHDYTDHWLQGFILKDNFDYSFTGNTIEECEDYIKNHKYMEKYNKNVVLCILPIYEISEIKLS